MPLLPIHRTNISRSFHFRTGTPRPNFHCLITCWDPPTQTRQVVPLGSWQWTTTTVWIYLGKTKERLPEWQTHHFFCGLSVSSYAQHPGSTYFPVDSSGVRKSLCVRGCLHTFDHSQVSACRRRSHSGQPGSCWILHQHWPRAIRRGLVHAPRLP